MVNQWIFKSFKNDNGENEIEKWIESHPEKAQAAIDRRLRFLKTQPVWTANDIKKRKGADNIYEIRITHNKIQYRPLGFYGPQRQDFCFVIGAIEKGSKLEPRQADSIAEKRRRLIMDNEEKYAVEYL